MAARKSKAKRKPASKRASRNKGTQSQLPSGYTAIGGFNPTWPNEETPEGDMIEGTIESYREVPVKRGKKTDTVNVMTAELSDGSKVDIWESGGLRSLFEYEEGAEFALIFDGYGEAKRGQNAPKLFRVGVVE